MTKWVAYNDHDELRRAIEQIDNLQAVVDAAVLFCHHDKAAHHGPNEYHRTKSRKNLFDEVATYEERDY